MNKENDTKKRSKGGLCHRILTVIGIVMPRSGRPRDITRSFMNL